MNKMYEFIALMKKRGEQGWSLTSTLVAVALTVIVGVIVVGIIVSAQKTSSQFTDTVMTESELNGAVSDISKQLTSADAILYAGGEVLKVSNTVKDTKRETTFFSWSPESSNLEDIQKATPEITASQLPDFPAIMSYTVVGADGDSGEKTEFKVLVNGYVPADNMPLFTYFDAEDVKMEAPVAEDKLSLVKRVQVVIKASVDGRDAPMEVATSVTPRGGNSGTQGEEWEENNEPLAAPVLKGNVAPRTTTTNLSWNFVDRADSYTLYAKVGYTAVGSPSYRVVGTTAGNSMKHENLNKGDVYSYYVVANNVNGSSPMSNVVALPVTPKAPSISGKVNADFTNTIYWSPVYGSHGYRVIRDGKTIWTSNISSTPDYRSSGMATRMQFDDKTAKAGEKHTYKAVAMNARGTGIDNNLGNGDSEWSNEIELYANPAAPTLTGSVDKGDRNLSWTQVDGAEGYQLQRISPSTKDFSEQSTTTLTDKDVIVSSEFNYRVRAKTPFGWGNWSNIVKLNPNPAPVQPVVYDYTDSSSSYNGKNKVTWPSSQEASYYDYRASTKTQNFSNLGNTLSTWDTAAPDTRLAYDVRACNYTGCSPHKWDFGLQPPGPFSITGYSDYSRTGFWSHRKEDNKDLSKESADFNWSTSNGADSYALQVGSKTIVGSTTSRNVKVNDGNYDPGSAYTVKATAKGNTSGLTRTTSYKWQATPAQPDNVAFRFQYKDSGSASSEYSRLEAWASKEYGGSGYKSSKGSYTNLQVRYGDRWKNSSNEDYKFGQNSTNAWDNWTKTVYTKGFYYRNINESAGAARGGMAWTRTYKSVASGYRGSAYSQDSNTSRNWMTNGNQDQYHHGGYRGLYGGTVKGKNTAWTAQNSVNPAPSTGGAFKTVPWSQANHPSTTANGKCSRSCATFWMITSR